MRNSTVSPWLLCFALAASPAAFGETLYKMIDKSGKVTYGEKPPQDFDGQVIRIDIDPNANTATLPKPPPPQAAPMKAGPEQPAGIKVRTPGDTARENLDKARRALENVRDNPSDTDFRFVANAGGGTRRIPTDDYLSRVAAMEQAVKRAETEAAKYQEKK